MPLFDRQALALSPRLSFVLHRQIYFQELKMGLSQASVLSVFHPDAEEFYNVNNNLEKVGLIVHWRLDKKA